ncbi:MAG: hypothetical protein ABI889_05160 [Gemmatimonadota bacterium]
MAKLTLVVAALVALSVTGSRVQAQSQQLAFVDQPVFVEPFASGDQPVQETPTAEQTAAVEQIASLQPTMATEILIVENTPAPVAAKLAATSGPTRRAATLSPRLASSSSKDMNAMRRPSRGSGVGLMILGGAALITGLVIGDNAGTVIAVGGALIGLYGLYVYLGRPSGMEHNDRIGLGYKLATP